MLSRLLQRWQTVRHHLSFQYQSCLSHSTEASKPAISQKVKFIDQLRVVARGGQGGGGSSALFGRTGHHPRAAGGNGASGGSVLLRATRQLTGLGSIPLHVEAARGGYGGKQWMDGKKGSDKVVAVPLGTMVWRLVQLRGAGAHTPHGVTPLTPQPTSQQVKPQQQQDPISFTHSSDPSSSQTLTGQPTSPHSISSNSHSSHQSRRRLFSNDQLDGRPPAVQQVSDTTRLQQGQTMPANLSPSSSSCCSPSGDSVRTSLSPTEGQQAGVEGEGDLHAAADTDRLDTQYQDLVSCRVTLSNSHKLHLLHYGSLQDPTAQSVDPAAAVLGQDGQLDDAYDESDLEGGSSSEADGEWGQEEGAGGDDWEVQQQPADSAWKGMGEYGHVEGRQFSKQQVWSILAAQAELLGVLEVEGQELLVAAGGRGGRGNAVAPSQHNRPASRIRSDGQLGQEVLLWLQLRLMADVALVGLPNVGKSSLIAALTGARAQVGSYAFTTLRPQLGTLLPTVPAVTAAQDTLHTTQATPPASAEHTPGSVAGPPADHGALAAAAAAGAESDGGLTGHKLVLADLPGVVPGAHLGKGRGTDFLKHLQKARCVALVIDVTGRADGQVDSSVVDNRSEQELSVNGWEAVVPHTPEQQLKILLEELRSYDANTMSMPMLVVANKVDAVSVDAAAAVLQRLKAVTDLPIVPVSAQQHLGLLRLKQSLELLAGGSS